MLLQGVIAITCTSLTGQEMTKNVTIFLKVSCFTNEV